MTWFFAVVVVLAMGGIALVASGRGAPMVDEYDDRPDALVPADGELGPQDLRRVRFSLGFRGYRMSEVDALLSRLADEMEVDQAWQPTTPLTDPQPHPAVDSSPDRPVGLEKQDDVPTERREDDAPSG